MSEQQTYPSLEGKQFMYDLDIAFPDNGSHIKVLPRTLTATNVVQTGATRWEFNLNGLVGRFHTHYGWSLVLDTPINRERVLAYLQLRTLSDQAQKMTSVAREHLETLQPKSGEPELTESAKNTLTEK